MGTRLSDQLEIRRPSSQMMARLYGLMGEVFPSDRALMQHVLDGSVRLGNWDHFVISYGHEIVSHAALVHMRIWWHGQTVPVCGVASVFTMPSWRQQGLATRLLSAALESVEPDTPAVLFTSMPAVYEGIGFEAAAQGVQRVAADEIRIASESFEVSSVRRLEPVHLEVMARVYEERGANDDGKLVRDGDYWPFYRELFNARGDVALHFCRRGGQTLGYVRVEREPEAVLVSELCAPRGEPALVQALLAQAAAEARLASVDDVAIALPASHAAWTLLDAQAVTRRGDDTSRETFMMRSTSQADRLTGLRWSLADKF